MLERASTCLESGGRLLQAPRRGVRSRRMLHSSFWHHAACEPNVPASWIPQFFHADSETHVDDSGSKAELREQRATTGLLLDFLYPAKTVALLHRISSDGFEPLETRRLHSTRRHCIRQFSTNRRDAWRSSEVDVRPEVEERLQSASASEALQRLLKSKERGKQEVAWQLYEVIDVNVRTPDMQASLLDYLTVPDAQIEPQRVLHMFETIPHEHRQHLANRVLRVFNNWPQDHRPPASYRAAISAHLSLQMIGPAVKLHEEAAARFDDIDIGTGMLLGRAVQDNQWDLALKILEVAREQSKLVDKGADLKGSLGVIIWGPVLALPSLQHHLQSLLQHARQFRHELFKPNQQTAISLLLDVLVPRTFGQTLNVTEPDEDAIWKFFTDFFRDVRQLGISKATWYERAITEMMSLPRYCQYTNRRKPFLSIYEKFKQEAAEKLALETPAQGATQQSTFCLSRSLLRALISQLCEMQSLNATGPAQRTTVSTLVQDWRKFHGKPPVSILFKVMMSFAEDGNADEVHRYFNEIRDLDNPHHTASTELKLKHISALLHVHARRIDVEGAHKQFDRISEEFGLTPDLVCWNILIQAHSRAEDLDGAIVCFKRLVATSLKPDFYTFAPLLSLCARRGDVEAVEGLFSQATLLNIPIQENVEARAKYVLACLNSGDVEGAEAISQRMLQDHQTGKLPGKLTSTWNLLISHYAAQGDIVASRRIYKQMVQSGISLNSDTYSALMRALVELRQTNAAYKILRVTMPNNNVQVHAFHYALVITGFIREGQYDHAMSAYKRMLQRNTRQTVASRLATLNVIGMTELQKLKNAGDKNPLTRLVEVEEALRLMLLDSEPSDSAPRQPQYGRYFDSPCESMHGSYYAFLILLYGTRGAIQVCKELFEAAALRKKDEPREFQHPISLLTAIMEAHCRAKEYDEVEKCWKMAREQADKLSRPWEQAVGGPRAPQIEFSSIVDASLQQKAASQARTTRRNILTHTTRIYIRSLAAKNDWKALRTAQKTIAGLLTNGYVLDNLTWNEFIEVLAKRGQLVDAFTACEAYLMPGFPGWKHLNPAYRTKTVKGFDNMNIKAKDLPAPEVGIPRYKTLVILAGAWAQIKREEASGMGYNPAHGGWAREVLEKVAPTTVRAVITMPRRVDHLQRQYLAGL